MDFMELNRWFKDLNIFAWNLGLWVGAVIPIIIWWSAAPYVCYWSNS